MDKPTEVRSSGPVEPTTAATQPAITPPMHSGMNETSSSPVTGTLAADGPLPVAPPGYEILGVLGRGGMGVVYKARQVSLNRVVALKMILAGGYASSDELIRFVAESEAVARVDHPNVVRVFHAGQHDGLPFFAMEYVAGGTLSDRLRDGPLVPQAAAKLVEQTARGIAACHTVGLLHRDLKPQNVLLAADGTPKVTDFGLVKLLDGQEGPTTTGAVMGTPSYMAPEQAQGNTTAVGPASDVYGLGAVLYALLTGRPPFQAPTPMETLRQVEYDDPVTVRELQPGVPRDLETICLKCLEKDPALRYPTADALADDLRRFLTGEPILARPAGVIEKGWKWVRRNSLAAAAAAAVFLALAVGAGVALWQARVARAEAANARVAEEKATLERLAALDAEAKAVERERAERAARMAEQKQRETAEAIKGFIQEVLLQSSVYNTRPGWLVKPDQTVKEAVDQAARRIEVQFRNQPLIEAEIRQTIGNAYREMGHYDLAEAQFLRALDLQQGADPADPCFLNARVCLASVYVWQGAYQKAEAILAETLAAAEAARGPDDLTTLWSVYQLGVLYMNWGRHSDQVEGLLSRAYRGYVQIGGENHLGALGSLAALGVHAKRSGRLDQAERDFTRALAGRRAVLGDDHPYTIECYGLIGVVLAMQGQYDAAEPYLRQTLAGRRAVLGDDHPMTIESMAELGHLYQCQGQYTAAEPLLTRSLARSREVYGSYHVRTLNTLLLLAKLYLAMGRYAAAEPLYAELLAVLEGIGHRDYAFFATQSEFGEALLGQKKYSAAEPVLLSGYRGMLGQSDQTLTAEQKRDLLTAANRLARHYDGLGKPAEARRWRDTAAGYREIAPPPRPAKD